VLLGAAGVFVVLGALVEAVFEPLSGAALEPDSEDEPALALSLPAGLASAAVVPGATSAVLAPLLLLLRKSVTYQPEPLS
jgi:hypothetical protein